MVRKATLDRGLRPDDLVAADEVVPDVTEPAAQALLPGPQRATPPSPSSAASDSAAVTALTAQLPGFFRAYASGDQEALGRFLARGAVVTGLGGTVSFGSICGMEVPSGGATRRIAVSVVWQLASQSSKARGRHSQDASVNDSSAGLEMTYQMTVLRQHGSWYVQAIGPSACAASHVSSPHSPNPGVKDGSST
jgi:Conjugative transposon protein TcpC